MAEWPSAGLQYEWKRPQRALNYEVMKKQWQSWNSITSSVPHIQERGFNEWSQQSRLKRCYDSLPDCFSQRNLRKGRKQNMNGTVQKRALKNLIVFLLLHRSWVSLHLRSDKLHVQQRQTMGGLLKPWNFGSRSEIKLLYKSEFWFADGSCSPSRRDKIGISM